jgi:hypothetical protein
VFSVYYPNEGSVIMSKEQNTFVRKYIKLMSESKNRIIFGGDFNLSGRKLDITLGKKPTRGTRVIDGVIGVNVQQLGEETVLESSSDHRVVMKDFVLNQKVILPVKVPRTNNTKENKHVFVAHRPHGPAGWTPVKIANTLLAASDLKEYWRLRDRLTGQSIGPVPPVYKRDVRPYQRFHEASFYNIKLAGPKRSIFKNKALKPEAKLDAWRMGTKYYKVIHKEFLSDIMRNLARNKAMGPDVRPDSYYRN